MANFLNKSTAGLPLDGFDPQANYQMVPLDGRRTVTIKTDSRAAKLRISLNRRAILLGNFRNISGSVPDGLNSAAQFSNDKDFSIPANATISFDIKGQQFANAAIELEEIVPVNTVDFSDFLLIGVKPKITKKVAFVFVSDIRGNVQTRFQEKNINPRALLRDVGRSLLAQVNLELQDVDEGSDIKEISIIGDLGDPIVLDKPKNGNDSTNFFIISQVFTKFPRLFPSTHFVILLTRPVQFLKDKTVLYVNFLTATGSNVIYMTPFSQEADRLQIALMHEIGHASGADHTTSVRNIMFPNIDGTNKSFLAEHIEVIHHGGPIFPK